MKKPDYFVATSTGAIASNPNSLRDMGGTRNVPYQYADVTNDGHAQQVTWKDLASQEATLRKINQQLTAPHTGVRLQQYPEESELRYQTVEHEDQTSVPEPVRKKGMHRSHKSTTNIRDNRDIVSQSSGKQSIFNYARDVRESARNIDKLIKNPQKGKKKQQEK